MRPESREWSGGNPYNTCWLGMQKEISERCPLAAVKHQKFAEAADTASASGRASAPPATSA